MKIHSSKPQNLAAIRRYSKKSLKTLPAWMKYLEERNEVKDFDHESEMQLGYRIKYPWKAFLTRIKVWFQGNVFWPMNKNDEFFLFPLHIQPESSTSVLATYYYDQINTIKNTAFCLPFPYKLYVKEHPVIRGDRPFDFYKKIKEIPNVVLISPLENTEEVVKRSKGVVTLTSTIGLEAALAGKPVYVLGNVFYSHHPSCRKIAGFEDLKEKIKKDLEKPERVENLEEKNISFMVSYARNTIKGDISSASSGKDTNDYKEMIKEIKDKFLK